MTSKGYTLGSPLKIKIDEHLIKSSIFDVKHDGNIDFLINKKTFVQEVIQVSVFSRQEKKLPDQESNPGLQITILACYH